MQLPGKALGTIIIFHPGHHRMRPALRLRLAFGGNDSLVGFTHRRCRLGMMRSTMTMTMTMAMCMTSTAAMSTTTMTMASIAATRTTTAMTTM